MEGSELKDVEVLVGIAVIDPTIERPLKARLADDAEWRKLALSSFGVMYQGGKVSDWAGGGFEVGCEALHVEVDVSSATLTLAKGSVGAGEAWPAATEKLGVVDFAGVFERGAALRPCVSVVGVDGPDGAARGTVRVRSAALTHVESYDDYADEFDSPPVSPAATMTPTKALNGLDAANLLADSMEYSGTFESPGGVSAPSVPPTPAADAGATDAAVDALGAEHAQRAIEVGMLQMTYTRAFERAKQRDAERDAEAALARQRRDAARTRLDAARAERRSREAETARAAASSVWDAALDPLCDVARLSELIDGAVEARGGSAAPDLSAAFEALCKCDKGIVVETPHPCPAPVGAASTSGPGANALHVHIPGAEALAVVCDSRSDMRASHGIVQVWSHGAAEPLATFACGGPDAPAGSDRALPGVSLGVPPLHVEGGSVKFDLAVAPPPGEAHGAGADAKLAELGGGNWGVRVLVYACASAADGQKQLTSARQLATERAVLNSRSPERGETALHCAAWAGHDAAAALLISRGANVDARDVSGGTPLHAAARAARVSLIELLARAGASVVAADEQGDTPLHLACGRGNVLAAKALIRADPELCAVSTENGQGKRPSQRVPQRGVARLAKTMADAERRAQGFATKRHSDASLSPEHGRRRSPSSRGSSKSPSPRRSPLHPRGDGLFVQFPSTEYAERYGMDHLEMQ